jgi:hypothetical protein
MGYGRFFAQGDTPVRDIKISGLRVIAPSAMQCNFVIPSLFGDPAFGWGYSEVL